MWTRLSIAAVLVFGTFAAGWLTYDAGKTKGRSEVQTAWDNERAITAQAHAEELMKARQREQALQGLAKKLRQEKVDEAKRLAAQHQRDLDGLRDRPNRDSAGELPDPSTAGAGPAPGCTGAQLFREDSAVLVGIARDADQLRLALRQCQAQYNQVSEVADGVPKA